MHRAPARKPRTGETVPVGETVVPSFRPGAAFKERVAASEAAAANATSAPADRAGRDGQRSHHRDPQDDPAETGGARPPRRHRRRRRLPEEGGRVGGRSRPGGRPLRRSSRATVLPPVGAAPRCATVFRAAASRRRRCLRARRSVHECCSSGCGQHSCTDRRGSRHR
ncbi:HU family DNA-binding protein [Pseudonocardia sp. ICBG601]|uniref:HU family DNA-binding protein n=1 Tax=Pseudonocardia sp. ICBG601 TaxID=2846759 RepID=UPI0035ABA4C5